MANGKTDVEIVEEILNQLEGHPNFVKANRIIDELSRRPGKVCNQEEEST
jgi:hypothetical protein